MKHFQLIDFGQSKLSVNPALDEQHILWYHSGIFILILFLQQSTFSVSLVNRDNLLMNRFW